MPWSSWPCIGVIDTGSVSGQFSVPPFGISDGFTFVVAELLELELEPHPAASATVANRHRREPASAGDHRQSQRYLLHSTRCPRSGIPEMRRLFVKKVCAPSINARCANDRAAPHPSHPCSRSRTRRSTTNRRELVAKGRDPRHRRAPPLNFVGVCRCGRMPAPGAATASAPSMPSADGARRVESISQSGARARPPQASSAPARSGYGVTRSPAAAYPPRTTPAIRRWKASSG